MALMNFVGIRRRLEVVGTAKDITVIDDFGHNPDKIAATLATLHAFPGRLLVMWQPHGYGPHPPDEGPVHRDVRARPRREGRPPDARARLFRRHRRQVDGVERHRRRRHRTPARPPTPSPDRPACGDKLVELAQPGDLIVIMGARDDTLSEFAADVLRRVGEKSF